MTNQNAVIGMDVERLFKNSIGRHLDVLNKLKLHFGIKGEYAKSFSTGTDAGKSDVIIRFTDATLSANIKAYKTGFNQLTRTTISSFCKTFNLEHLQAIFEDGALRVAGRLGRFILASDETLIVAAISPLARDIVHFSLARDENPELLVLYYRATNIMNLYDMKDLLDNLNYEVTISGRGVIKIGKFITIQRKGGNGVHSIHIPKTSLDHPGNNLQVKMKVGTFVLATNPIVAFEP
ncbi:MAG: hypothetical protein ACT4O9_17360 [Blastocatellia bacterium]